MTSFYSEEELCELGLKKIGSRTYTYRHIVLCMDQMALNWKIAAEYHLLALFLVQ